MFFYLSNYFERAYEYTIKNNKIYAHLKPKSYLRQK